MPLKLGSKFRKLLPSSPPFGVKPASTKGLQMWLLTSLPLSLGKSRIQMACAPPAYLAPERRIWSPILSFLPLSTSLPAKLPAPLCCCCASQPASTPPPAIKLQKPAPFPPPSLRSIHRFALVASLPAAAPALLCSVPRGIRFAADGCEVSSTFFFFFVS